MSINLASIFTIPLTKLDGQASTLADFQGQALLIVNTASECGFTPQYQGLQKLHRKYHQAGLAVLGFPCNQFGEQEPGTAAEIGQFCQREFGVTFPLFAKIEVNGPSAHPLFVALKKAAPGETGEDIPWNFTKFLIDPQAGTIRRFAPATTPEQLDEEIASLVNRSSN